MLFYAFHTFIGVFYFSAEAFIAYLCNCDKTWRAAAAIFHVLLFLSWKNAPKNFTLKAQFTPKIENTDFFLLHLVLFINLNSFGVSCLVLEILAVEISAFSQI